MYTCRFIQVMWFSNGGTNGSVHIDATENVLCSFRGQKLFTMVDPMKYGLLVTTCFLFLITAIVSVFLICLFHFPNAIFQIKC